MIVLRNSRIILSVCGRGRKHFTAPPFSFLEVGSERRIEDIRGKLLVF